MKTHFIAVFLVLQSGWTVSAQEASLGSCQIFGQVFGIDPLGGDMLVKSPSGAISGLRFEQATTFARASLNASAAPIRIMPAEVNDGDVICARGVENPTSAVMAASTALVVSRIEIQKRQKDNLSGWSKSGAFGEVVKVNPQEGSIVLRETHRGGAGGSLLVKTSPSTRLRRYLPGAGDLTDGAAVSLPGLGCPERPSLQ